MSPLKRQGHPLRLAPRSAGTDRQGVVGRRTQRSSHGGRADSHRAGKPLRPQRTGTDCGRAEIAGDEIRQAAVWGLGKAGLKAYDQLPFIGDTDENLALHAIAAFGSDTPEAVIRQLVSELATADSRRACSFRDAEANCERDGPKMPD